MFFLLKLLSEEKREKEKGLLRQKTKALINNPKLRLAAKITIKSIGVSYEVQALPYACHHLDFDFVEFFIKTLQERRGYETLEEMLNGTAAHSSGIVFNKLEVFIEEEK